MRVEWVASSLPQNMVYPALLPLLLLVRTLRLPVVDLTDTPANLKGHVCFSERPNLVSARVPSRFKHCVLLFFLGVSSPLCWFNNKEYCVLHVQSNTTIFHLVVQ